MFQKIREHERRIIEVDSPKETSAIVITGKPTGDFDQKASKSIDLIENYIQKLDWKVRENSNMSYSLQGLNNFISSDVTSQYWLNRIYPTEIRHAHENGDIHIHDLSMLSAYCVGWDLKELLKQGSKGVGGRVESGPSKHLGSALGQIVNFFYTLQGEALYGKDFYVNISARKEESWEKQSEYKEVA